MKSIFYYTDVLPLLAREGAAIEKLKRNMKIFREASEEIKIVWHPYSKTIEYLKLNSSPVINDYEEIFDSYIREGWGELDRTDSLTEAKKVLMKCSAYYGDVCDLVYEAQCMGIPVMLQNIDI